MATDSQNHICPNCQMDLEKVQGVIQDNHLAFCLQCQFPLQLVAGKYRLEKEIWRGSCSTVYVARHVNLAQDAERVVKVMRPELFNISGMKRRFKQEVQITSALSQGNDHIVQIYDDFGEIPLLGHFYVMEYLQGETLSELLADLEALPPVSFCLHLFLQLCETMQFAHEQGIVHRDLKPHNLILIQHKNQSHFLKIFDFGIAKPLNNEELAVTHVTQGSLGTPAYMSPEQCLNQPTDVTTDIYSMGIILYEMLTGRTPFASQSNEPSFSGAVSVIEGHLTKAPPPPSELVPERVSPTLEAIILKALEKKQANRYQSIKELQKALEPVIDGLPKAEREQLRLLSSEQETMNMTLPRRPKSDVSNPIPHQLLQGDGGNETWVLGASSRVALAEEKEKKASRSDNIFKGHKEPEPHEDKVVIKEVEMETDDEFLFDQEENFLVPAEPQIDFRDWVNKIQGPRDGLVQIFVLQKESWDSDPFLVKNLRDRISALQGYIESNDFARLYPGCRGKIILESYFFPPEVANRFIRDGIELRLRPQLSPSQQQLPQVTTPATPQSEQAPATPQPVAPSSPPVPAAQPVTPSSPPVAVAQPVQAVVQPAVAQASPAPVVQPSSSPAPAVQPISQPSSSPVQPVSQLSVRLPQGADSIPPASESIGSYPPAQEQGDESFSDDEWDDEFVLQQRLGQEEAGKFYGMAVVITLFVFSLVGMLYGLSGGEDFSKAQPQILSPSAVSSNTLKPPLYSTVRLRPDRRTFIFIPVTDQSGKQEIYILFAAKENRRLVVLAPHDLSGVIKKLEKKQDPDDPSQSQVIPHWSDDLQGYNPSPNSRSYTGSLERLQRYHGGPLELRLPGQKRDLNKIPGFVKAGIRFPMDSMLLLVGQRPKPPSGSRNAILFFSIFLAFASGGLLFALRKRMNQPF